MAKLSKANTELFAEIIDELNGDENAVVYIDDSRYTALAKLELIEFNASLTDEDGNVATRLTEKGKEQANMTTQVEVSEQVEAVNENTVAPAVEEAPKRAKVVTSVVTDVVIPVPDEPKTTRRSKYPFADLTVVGASFFVKASDKDNGDMARRLKQRCSAMNVEQRKAGTDLRYLSRAIVDGAPWGDEFAGVKGAAVWRVTPADVDKQESEDEE